MASESRLYTFSGETKKHLNDFRLGSSRAKGPLAVIYMIDKATQEVRLDAETETKGYTSLEELSDDLPDNSPRFVLLSYPTTASDGRLKVPYVLLYYLPNTCNNEMRMLYAGAKELMRSTAGVARVIDVESTDDFDELPEKLSAL